MLSKPSNPSHQRNPTDTNSLLKKLEKSDNPIFNTKLIHVDKSYITKNVASNPSKNVLKRPPSLKSRRGKRKHQQQLSLTTSLIKLNLFGKQ